MELRYIIFNSGFAAYTLYYKELFKVNFVRHELKAKDGVFYP